tara:strand:+ start:40 stop:438 length:399 start_codon:yes stop_codon:yes gene_type:complete
MNALLDKLGINESDVIANTTAKAKGKETTDSDSLRNVRKLMNNTFLQHTELVNNATYFEPMFKRDENKRILLDKDNKKVVEGYKQKSLTGSFIIEDNNDGTHTATRFNVYKDTYLVDSNSLNIAKITTNKTK